MGLFQQMWDSQGGPPPNRAERRQAQQARNRESRRATRSYNRRLKAEAEKEAKTDGAEG